MVFSYFNITVSSSNRWINVKHVNFAIPAVRVLSKAAVFVDQSWSIFLEIDKTL
jgi:hypothetical protein